MHEPDLLKIFVKPLNKLGISYVITGAIASIVYGEPRLTHDVDLVLELYSKDVDKLTKEFPADMFYITPSEVILLELTRKEGGHFNIIHQTTGLRADIFLVGRDNFSKWALDNYKTINIGESNYRIASPEYVIIRKLEYYREGGSDKHIRDIKSILEISPEKINIPLLEKIVKERSLEKEWKISTR